MTSQTSRLEIIIDTSKAKKNSDDTAKSLETLEKQGDKTSASVEKVGKYFKNAGGQIVDANGKLVSAKKAAADLGVSVDVLGKSLTNYQKKIKSAGDQTKATGDDFKSTSSKMSELRKTLGEAANDGRFGSQVQSLSTKLSGLSGGAVLVGASIAGALVGGVAVASGYLANMALEVAKNNVELAQLSAIANTSIANFQGLSGAAATFGVSSEKTADMLKDFNEKIGEFNSIGAGGAVDFFEQIAVKTEGGAKGAKKLAEEMSKMDGVDALQVYVDKLEEAGVNQKEMSFYLESMGSDLTALAPLLVDGGQLWKDYQKAMEDAGILTGEEAIQKSIELTAQTESLQMQFSAFKNELASQMMPILSQLLSYFMDGSSEGGKFGGVIEGIGVMAKGVASVIVGLATGMKNLVEIMSLVVNQFKTIGTTAVNFAKADGIQAKGQALLSGAKDFVWGNGAKAAKNILNNSKDGFNAIGNILSSQAGKYDTLTQAIINNKNAQLKWNKEQGRGVGGGAEQNKNLFPTQKSPKAKKDNSATKAMNEAKRLAEQQKREAERQQKEIERAKESVIREYATKEQRLLLDYQESKEEIEKGFVNDPTNRDLYLKKAKDTYEKELAAYRSAQKDKLESYQRDFADKLYSANSAIGLSNIRSIYGENSLKYKSANLSADLYDKQRSEQKNYDDDIKSINKDYDTPELANERYALLEQAKQAHIARMQQMDIENNEASKELITQQLQMQLSSFSSLAGSLKGLVSECSSTYAALHAIQKSFHLASVLMSSADAIGKAWASAAFPYNMPAVAMATIQTGALQATIEAVTPGFATGGFTGTGGKFDPAGIVHKGEVVWSQEDIKRWGGVNVVEAMRTSQPPKGYSDGGLVTPKDTYRVGMGTVDAINRGADVQAERQAQANVRAGAGASANVNLNPNFVIVDERQNLSDYLYSPDGTKAFVKFFKRNRSALGV
jgi:hypothetical protein